MLRKRNVSEIHWNVADFDNLVFSKFCCVKIRNVTLRIDPKPMFGVENVIRNKTSCQNGKCSRNSKGNADWFPRKKVISVQTRPKRLKRCAEAQSTADKLSDSLRPKLELKKNYLDQKIELLRKLVTAKETIAAAKVRQAEAHENVAQSVAKIANIFENFTKKD